MTTDDRTIRLLAAYEDVLNALNFYADPDTYFAVAIIADPPAGDFMDDFDEGHTNYGRAMPGKRARAALAAWAAAIEP